MDAGQPSAHPRPVHARDPRVRGTTTAPTYRRASRFGREPQPGFALMRLAQGKHAAAVAAMRRAMTEAALPLRRVALLPAQVEILVATGDIAGSRAACDELSEIARRQGSEALTALAEQA